MIENLNHINLKPSVWEFNTKAFYNKRLSACKKKKWYEKESW